MDLLLSRCIGRVVETDATEDSTAMHALHCAKLPTVDPILTSIYWIQRPKKKDTPYLDACILRPSKNPMIGGSSLGSPISLLSNHAAHPELIGLPRYLGLSLFGRPAKDRRTDGPPISATFQCDLFAHQAEVTARCLNVLSTWGGATLIADCGVGKTGMALYILSQLKTKTCILCNRTVLMEQWREAITKFLGAMSVGTLQGTAKVDTSADIVVASIDTVINLRRDDVKSFGLVIVDEMHHIAAASLVHAVPLFSAKYTLGLTATPTRSDGLEHALYWLVGPAACVYQRVPELTGKRGTVLIRKCLFSEGLQKEIIYFNGTLGFSAMITELAADPKRNALLRSFIEWSLEHRHRIVVVTSLVSHAQALRLDASGQPYARSALMAGTSKNRQDAKDAKIIFATYSMLEEGYDDPSLDTLILATPRSNVQQTIGRVERECPGKQTPIVFDLVDAFSLYPNMYWKRQKFYTSRGFSIEMT